MRGNRHEGVRQGVGRDLMVSGKVWERLDCVQLSVVRDLVVPAKV